MKHIEKVENSATLALEGKKLQLYRLDELTEDHARRIVAASNEPEMREQVPEDHEQHFSDVESAMRWFGEENRRVYILGRGATLAGLASFTEKPIPSRDIEASYAYKIRLYEKARGRGFGRAVMAATHTDFRQGSRYEGPTWLSVDNANTHARRLFDKFGYELVGGDETDSVMLRPGSVGYGAEQ